MPAKKMFLDDLIGDEWVMKCKADSADTVPGGLPLQLIRLYGWRRSPAQFVLACASLDREIERTHLEIIQGHMSSAIAKKSGRMRVS